MASSQYKINYGKNGLSFPLPDNFLVDIAAKEGLPQIQELETGIKQALDSPVNSLPLTQTLSSKSQVCIVVTDNTRPCPNHLLLPPLLEKLLSAGVKRERIKILIGGGLHRTLGSQEKAALLGQEVCQSFEICDHNASDKERMRSLGSTDRGTPVEVNRLVWEADFVISTGVIEPHQYAGFSGGRKTVAIGAAGEETIKTTHNYHFLNDEFAFPGNLSNNLFHEEISAIADRMGLSFILNVILND
ncbi:MAG: lactate racemase domain-containing protein, partial [bacterium]